MLYIEFSNSNNNFEEKPNNIYSNLNIDKSKLNIGVKIDFGHESVEML